MTLTQRIAEIHATAKPYRHHGLTASAEMIGHLRAYAEHGAPLGDFLGAVVDNDLSKACSRADEENAANLPALVAWLYNEAPHGCWGYAGAYGQWIESHRRKRKGEIGG